MKAKRTTIAILFGLVVVVFGATLHAGDWEKAPIENLGGLQNANTDLKKPTIMELGRRGGADGHPGAWGEMEVDCGEHLSSGDHWCNVQLEIIFSKSRNHERVKIQILDGDDQPLKTAYLLNSNTDDVRARVYFVGAKCVDGSLKVRVSLRGDEKTIKGHARVTFLRSACENEDKTNWQVASNWPLYDAHGRVYKRPTFLFLQ